MPIYIFNCLPSFSLGYLSLFLCQIPVYLRMLIRHVERVTPVARRLPLPRCSLPLPAFAQSDAFSRGFRRATPGAGLPGTAQLARGHSPHAGFLHGRRSGNTPAEAGEGAGGLSRDAMQTGRGPDRKGAWTGGWGLRLGVPAAGRWQSGNAFPNQKRPLRPAHLSS